ncbi:MAG: DVU0298 family protein [Desulfovibrionaceae bacterium]
MASFRRLKSRVRDILADQQWRDRLTELEDLGPGQVKGPLFSLLLDKDEAVRWRAAAGFGWLARRMAAESMESARELMRMFMWRMNEESGNLGWGVPEAMASAMARNETLAREFHSILASYAQTGEGRDGNYLDHAELRRGVYWGLGRLARAFPDMARQHAGVLRRGLRESDAVSRGYAAWALGILRDPEDLDRLQELAGEDAEIALFRDGHLEKTSVARLAREAVRAIRSTEADHA